MNYKVITLRRGKEESLDRFHPWVFSGAIAHFDDEIDEGDLVSVITHDGRLVGHGHYQVGSIAVRMLTFDDTSVDADFYACRLSQAFKLRQVMNLDRADNDSYRVVHGEGDFLPGLVVDKFGEE